jgi:hypothetical protein
MVWGGFHEKLERPRARRGQRKGQSRKTRGKVGTVTTPTRVVHHIDLALDDLPPSVGEREMAGNRRENVGLRGPLVAGKCPKTIVIRVNRFSRETIQAIMEGEGKSDGFRIRSDSQHRRTNCEVHGVGVGRLKLRHANEIKRTPLAEQTVVNQDVRMTNRIVPTPKTGRDPATPTTSMAQERRDRKASGQEHTLSPAPEST